MSEQTFRLSSPAPSPEGSPYFILISHRKYSIIIEFLVRNICYSMNSGSFLPALTFLSQIHPVFFVAPLAALVDLNGQLEGFLYFSIAILYFPHRLIGVLGLPRCPHSRTHSGKVCFVSPPSLLLLTPLLC